MPERATVMSRSKKSAEALVAARRRAEGIAGSPLVASGIKKRLIREALCSGIEWEGCLHH